MENSNGTGKMTAASSVRNAPLAYCVVGWHFLPTFYETLYRLPGDKYIISHRDRPFVESQPVYHLIARDLIFCENIGLDWGAYHQFNALGYWRRYALIVYCHDDIIIRDPAFIDEVVRRFEDPRLMVLGNGRNGKDAEFRFGKYRHRMFYDDSDDFLVRTVRGSFFAARRELFEVIGNFPVYWKAKTLKKGNISLRNFAYLVCKHFGIDAVGYLDDRNYLKTRYIVELKRGDLDGTHREAIAESDFQK